MLNFKKTILATIAVFTVFFMFAQHASAVSISIDLGKMLELGCKSFSECIKVTLEAVVKLAFPVAVMLIIWSGFLYVSAMGNPEKIKRAHKMLLWTIVGLVIIVGAWALAVAFQNFFNKEL